MSGTSANVAGAQHRLRLGIDLGGTKIAGIVLGAGDRILAMRRVAAPREDYRATLQAIAEMVGALEADCGASCSIGIGLPGSISPVTGSVQGANSTWLNDRPFAVDVETALGRPVRVANDANCFALSEAVDGAAAGARCVFGVILGTGCGGALVVDGRLVDGPNAISGEWGHMPLPWPASEEWPGPQCWCGRRSCMELWVSGPGLAKDHREVTGDAMTAAAIAAAAEAGQPDAQATLDRHAGRLARGLAVLVDIVDPDVIVLGGGLSNIRRLYKQLPELMHPWVFAAAPRLRVVAPRWGDASGVRGAARLWG